MAGFDKMSTVHAVPQDCKGLSLLQVDVFALAMLMQEIFSHTITAVIVVGPTLHPRAAELYALKVSTWACKHLRQQYASSSAGQCMFPSSLTHEDCGLPLYNTVPRNAPHEQLEVIIVCKQVARGYRRPLGQSMPAPLQTLIQVSRQQYPRDMGSCRRLKGLCSPCLLSWCTRLNSGLLLQLAHA